MTVNTNQEKSRQLLQNEITRQRELNEHEDCIDPECPHCGSDNVYGISRIVGYFSEIGNWNKSKVAELKRRQKGNYWHEED